MKESSKRAISYAAGSGLWAAALYGLWRRLPEDERRQYGLIDGLLLLGAFCAPPAIDALCHRR